MALAIPKGLKYWTQMPYREQRGRGNDAQINANILVITVDMVLHFTLRKYIYKCSKIDCSSAV